MTLNGQDVDWSEHTAQLTYSVSHLVEGEYNFYLQEYVPPNYSAPAIFSLFIDRTPPEPPIVSSPLKTTDEYPVWEWLGSGGGSGVFKIGFANSEEQQVIVTTSFKPKNALAEGRHVLCVSEKDLAGNWSEYNCVSTLIDRTAPFPLYIFAVSPISDTLPHWQWFSGGGGVGVFRYALGFESLVEHGIVTTANSFTLPLEQLDIGFGEQKEYRLSVQERDDLNNWSEPAIAVVSVDKIPPLAPSVSATSPSSFSFWQWSGSGGGSGVFRHCLKEGDCAGTCLFADSIEHRQTSFMPAELPDGQWSLWVQEKDLAGNWSESACREQVIDTAKPSAPSFHGSSISSQPLPVWQWTSHSENPVFRFAMQILELETAAEQTDTQFKSEQPLSDGRHILYLQEKSTAGNWSEITSFAITVDTIAPNPPKLSAIRLTNNPRPFWEWEGSTDGSGHFRIYLNSALMLDGEYTAFQPEQELEDGIHILAVQERDAAGNWSSLESQQTEIDTIPPPLPEVTSVGLTNNPRPIWYWTGTSGNYFQYSLNALDWQNSPVTKDRVFQPAVNLHSGEHLLYVREQDLAGNWSEVATAMVKIILETPNSPILTIVDDMGSPFPCFNWQSSDERGAGLFRYGFNLPTLSAQQISNATSYTSNLALAVGQHRFYVQEKDIAGNWSEASYVEFTVHFNLTKGWLLASHLDYENIDGFFADFPEVDIIWSYEEANWGLRAASHITPPAGYAQLDSLKPRQGYWLKVNDDKNLQLNQSAPSLFLPQELNFGWQMRGGFSLSVTEFFARYPAAQEIYTIDADGVWLKADRSLSSSGGISILEPQKAYWIKLGTEQNRYVELISGGEARARHSATACQQKLFFFGGYNEQGYSDTLDIFSPFSGQWAKGSPSGISRYGHSAVCVQDQDIYVFGGENGEGLLNSLQIYHIASNSWYLGNASWARRGHQAFVKDNKIYHIGGESSNSDQRTFLKTADIYNIDTGIWETMDFFLEQSFFSLVQEKNDCYYIWGGVENANELIKYRLSDLQIISTKKAGTIRNFSAAAFWQGFLFLYGGKKEETTFNLMEIIDTRSSEVQNSTQTLLPRTEHSMTAYHNRLFVWGGRDEKGNFLNSLFMYYPSGAINKEVNYPPIIPLLEVQGDRDELNLHFDLYDEEADLVRITGLEYSFDGHNWLASTNFSPNKYSFSTGLNKQLAWNSRPELRINTDSMFIRLIFTDGINTEYSVKSASFSLNNNALPEARNLSLSGQSGLINVSFYLSDQDNDDLSFELQWAANNGENNDWQPVQSIFVLQGNEQSSAEGIALQLLWDSFLDIDHNMTEIGLRVLVEDGLNTVFSLPLYHVTINNGLNSAPQASHLMVEGAANNIFLSFSLFDADDDLIDVELEYYQQGSWRKSTFAGANRSLSSGTGHRLIWLSHLDIEENTNHLRLRICPNDNRFSTPVCAVSHEFSLFNANHKPTVNILNLSGNRHDISIDFSLYDQERSIMTVFASYSFDDGLSWQDIPSGHLSGQMVLLSNGNHRLIWHSHKTFLADYSQVKLRLLVSDGYQTSSSADSGNFFIHNNTQWSKPAFLQGGRLAATANLLDSTQVILSGGIDESGRFSNIIEKWNLRDNSKTVLGNMEQARIEHSAVLQNNSLYMFGGMNSDPRILGTMEIFNLTNNTLTTVKSDYLRMAHQAVFYNNHIRISGGESASGVTGDILSYNPKNQDWLLPISGGRARKGHSATLFGDSLYVWGGVNQQGAFLNRLNIYNFKTASWTEAKSGGTARMAHSATLYQDKIYFFGGKGAAGVLNSIDIYDLKKETWSSDSHGGIPRRNHNAFLLDNRIWYIGGANSNEDLELSVDIYTPENQITEDNHVPTISDMETSLERGIFTINFTAEDSDGDYLFPLLEYQVNNDGWRHIPIENLSLSENVFLSGRQGIISWNSLTVLTSCDLQVKLRLTVSDAKIGYLQAMESAVFSLCNAVNTEPSISNFIATNHQGLIKIDFDIYDADQDKMSIKLYYSHENHYTAGIWQEVTALEGALENLDSGSHQLLWLSPLDVKNDANIQLQIRLSDGRFGAGISKILTDYLVLADQNLVPIIANLRAETQVDTLKIYYDLSGQNIDNLLLFFSLDQGKSWLPVKNEDLTLNIGALQIGANYIHWNSIPYIEQETTDLLLRLMPQISGQSGVPGISQKLMINNGGQWETMFGEGFLRTAHSAVLHNAQIYFFGGLNNQNSTVNILDIYDINTGAWLAGTGGGEKRSHHSAVTYNGYMYVWGGNSSTGILNNLDIYNIANGTWSTGASGGTARYGHQAVVFNGEMFVFGGKGLNGVLNQIDVFNFQTGQWRTAPSGGTARYGLSCAIAADLVVCGGGKNDSGFIETLDIFHLTTNSWQDSQASPIRMFYGTAVSLNDGIIFHGGQGEGNLLISDTFFWQPLTGWRGLATSEVERQAMSATVYHDKVYYWAGQDQANWSSKIEVFTPPASILTPAPKREETSWKTIADQIDERYYQTTVQHQGQVFLLGGGNNQQTPLSNALVYNLNNQTLTEIAPPNIRRNWAAADVWRDQIFVMGGIDENEQVLSNFNKYNIAADEWQELANAPIGRYQHSAVVYGNKLYIWGGIDADHMFANTLEIFNFSSNQWEREIAGSNYRCQHSATLFDGRIYYWGGRAKQGQVLDSLDIYDTISQSWLKGSAGGAARYGHSAILYDGCIYFIGGFDEKNQPVLSIDVYNPDNNQWQTPLKSLSQPVVFHSVWQTKDQVCLFGGWRDLNKPRNSIDCLPLQSESGYAWQILDSNITPRFAHATVYHDGKLFYWSGQTNDGLSNNLDIYEAERDEWSSGISSDQARRYASGLSYLDKIYFFGGENSEGQVFDDIAIYEPQSWMTGSSGGIARKNYSAVLFGQCIYFWGGLDKSNRAISITDIFDLKNNTWLNGKSGEGNARSGHISVSSGGYIWHWGGYSSVDLVRSLERYTPSNNSFNATNFQDASHTLRHGHTGNMIGNLLYVFGGSNRRPENGLSTINSLDILDLSNPNNPTWRPPRAGGTSRIDHAACVIDDKLYFFGGRNEFTGIVDSIDIYDTITDSWQTKPFLGTPRYAHQAIYLNGLVFIFGGYDKNNQPLRSVDIFSPKFSNWSQGEMANDSRAFYTAISDEKSMKVFHWGGETGNNTVDTLEIYHILHDTKIKKQENYFPMTQARYEAADAFSQARLYIAGGRSSSGSGCLDNMAVYNLNNQQWETIPNFLENRCAATLVPFNENIYLWGGAGNGINEYANTMEVYDSSTEQWEILDHEHVPNGRLGLDSAIIRDNIFYWGGEQAGNQKPIIYNITKDAWYTGAAAFERREYAAIAAVGTKIFVFGGKVSDYGNENTNEVLIYDTVKDAWEYGLRDTVSRRQHTATVSGNMIYLWGGIDNQGRTLSNLRSYNTLSSQWSDLGDGGDKRSLHSAVISTDYKIYFWGGKNESGDVLESLSIYDIKDQYWFRGLPSSITRYDHTAVFYQNKIYHWGGFGAIGVANDLIIYDIETNTWSSGNSGGAKRYGAKAEIYNGRMYIFGGKDGWGSLVHDIDIYDINTASWSKAEINGKKRSHHVANRVQGNIYYHGGKNKTGVLNTMDIYDLVNKRWVTAPNSDNKRTSHASVHYGENIYYHGGINENGEVLNTMEIFSTRLRTFQKTIDIPTARYGHRSATHAGKLYFFGGRNSSGGEPNDIDCFDVASETWTNLTLPLNRGVYFSAVNVDEQVYLIGGYTQNTALNTADRLLLTGANRSPWSFSKPGAQARKRGVAVEYNGKAYVWGGLNQDNQTISTMDVFDLDQQEWEESIDFPNVSWRYDHQGIVFQGHIYYLGGRDIEHQNMGNIDIFCPIKKSWQSVEMPRDYRRFSSTAVLYQDRFWQWGGNSINGLSLLIDIYDPVTNVWESRFGSNTMRRELSANLVGDTIYFFGGRDTDNGLLAHLEAFRPRLSGNQAPQIEYLHLSGQGEVKIDLHIVDADHDYINLRFEYLKDQKWRQISNSHFTSPPTQLPSGSCQIIWLSGLDIFTDSSNLQLRVQPFDGELWGEYSYSQTFSLFNKSPCQTDNLLPVTSETASFSLSLSYHTANEYQNKMLVYGGIADEKVSNALLEYNPKNKAWRYVGRGQKPRYGHSANIINDQLYLFGGYNNKSLASMEICTLPADKSGDEQTELNCDVIDNLNTGVLARHQHTAVMYQQKLFLYGGKSDLNNDFNTGKSLQIYDTQKKSWTDGSNGLEALYAHSALVVKNKLYIYGGTKQDGQISDNLYIFDFIAQKWSIGEKAAEKRTDMSGFKRQEQLYFFGGRNSQEQYQNSFLIYDTATGRWLTEKISANTARSLHSAVLVNNQAYLLGGVNPNLLSSLDIVELK